MFPGPIRVAIVPFSWQPGPHASSLPEHHPWALFSTRLFGDLFNGRNGWSLHDYWSRSTFGLMRLSCDVRRGYKLSGEKQADLGRHRRNVVIDRMRRIYLDDGGSLEGYEHLVVFVHPPPCDAGVSNRDALFDQAGGLEFFQHEVGHVLGFMHAFGPSGAYGDDYCLMGYTGPFDHPVPADPSYSLLTPRFWRSGRRVSAASLYRRFVSRDVGGSGDLRSGHGAAGAFDRRVAHISVGQETRLAALSQARNEQVVAVAPLPKGVLAVEYRTATGDDAGVRPAVVVHTIGARPTEAGYGEVDPPRFEAAIPPEPGRGLTVAVGTRGYQVRVLQAEAGAAPSVRVLVTGGIPVPQYPSLQAGWHWCANCQGIVYVYGRENGPCAHPDFERHDFGRSHLYAILHSLTSRPVSDGWRWCRKCKALIRVPSATDLTTAPTTAVAAAIPGPCAAGGRHDVSGSDTYHVLRALAAGVGEDNWWWCTRCQALVHAGGTGSCPAGGRHERGTTSYTVLHGSVPSTAQPNWRWCNKCQGLVHGGGTAGPCPAGGRHDHGSRDYGVLRRLAGNGSQSNWRWCRKCQGLFWGGNPPGPCPAGQRHDRTGSLDYTLLMNVGARQSNWRWCRKCQGLAFAGNGPGPCPAGSKHDHTGSADYSMLDEPPRVW